MSQPIHCAGCRGTDYLGRECRGRGAEAAEGAAPHEDAVAVRRSRQRLVEGAAPPIEAIDDLVQDIAGGIDGEPYLDRSGWERAHASLKVLAAAARLAHPEEERNGE